MRRSLQRLEDGIPAEVQGASCWHNLALSPHKRMVKRTVQSPKDDNHSVTNSRECIGQCRKLAVDPAEVTKQRQIYSFCLYIGVRGSPERGYFVPGCVGSGRWADFERCSRIHACGWGVGVRGGGGQHARTGFHETSKLS